jgi:transposase
MRGEDRTTDQFFSYVNVEDRIASDHPLRQIRQLVNDALKALDADFTALYAQDTGRPSIAPERLLRAMLLQAIYSIRSERQLMERLEFDLLFRWFVGLGPDEPTWNASTFSKNRDRLLDGEIAAKFLNAVLALRRVKKLLSREHFSVDGTLIEAWASTKSFRPKDQEGGSDNGGGPDGAGGGRNAPRDFHGEKWSNKTHASSTDPDARLYRKGRGKPAQLCYMGHVLMENRQGLAVATQLTHATGRAEREAALEMIRKRKVKRGATLGADKGYNAWTFKRDLEQAGVRPHVALKSETGRGGMAIKTPEGYEISQRIRKRIEEIFGWMKTTGGYAKTKFRGKRRVAHGFDIAIAAYNLVRLPKLLAGAAA